MHARVSVYKEEREELKSVRENEVVCRRGKAQSQRKVVHTSLHSVLVCVVYDVHIFLAMGQ